MRRLAEAVEVGLDQRELFELLVKRLSGIQLIRLFHPVRIEPEDLDLLPEFEAAIDQP